MFSGLVYKHIGGEGSILVSIASKFTAPGELEAVHFEGTIHAYQCVVLVSADLTIHYVSMCLCAAYPEELLVARATVNDVRRRVVTLTLQCQAVERGEVHVYSVCVHRQLFIVVSSLPT